MGTDERENGLRRRVVERMAAQGFPALGWGIGLANHAVAALTRTRVRAEPEAGGRGAQRLRKDAPVLSAGTQAVLDQAHHINLQILEQLKGFGRKHDELELVMAGIPMHDLEKDLATLKGRLAEAADEKLKEEYARSITEIEQHRVSFAELERERERLFFRLRSSVNSLKQMQIDVACMKSIAAGAHRSALDVLWRKSGELSTYLSDLRKGYTELEG